MRTKRCGGSLLYKSIAGMMRVYRMDGRRKLYSFCCSKCGVTGENNGRIRTCSLNDAELEELFDAVYTKVS